MTGRERVLVFLAERSNLPLGTIAGWMGQTWDETVRQLVRARHARHLASELPPNLDPSWSLRDSHQLVGRSCRRV